MMKSVDLQGKIIFKKYKLIKLIGEGTFSEVYLGQNIVTKKLYSIKVENKILKNSDLLEREAYILINLKCFGIPEVISFGKFRNYNILVQTLLGKSLEKLWYENNKSFSIKDICMIAIQTLDRIEFVHSKNYLHRDIKPANFLVGYPDSSIIYLIDFGVSKKYRSSRTGKHIQPLKTKKINGTTIFLSLNALRGNEQSRKDELESLGYMYIYLAKGGLPWSNIKAKKIEDVITKIGIMKSKINMEYLCQKLPNEFCRYMNYVKKLRFEQKPGYEYLSNLFKNVLYRIKERLDNIFSWVDRRNVSRDSRKSYSSITKRRDNRHTRLLNKITKDYSEKHNSLNSRKNIGDLSPEIYYTLNLSKNKKSNLMKLKNDNNEKKNVLKKNNNNYINISRIQENNKSNNNKNDSYKSPGNQKLLFKQEQIKRLINYTDNNYEYINIEGNLIQKKINKNNFNLVKNNFRKLNSGDNINYNKFKNKKNILLINRNTPLNCSNTLNSFKLNEKSNIYNIKKKLPRSNKGLIGEYYNKKINYIPLCNTSQVIINGITQNNIFCGNSQQFSSIPTYDNYTYINLSNNLKNIQSYADRYNIQTHKLINKNDFLIKNIESISDIRSLTKPTNTIKKANIINEHRNINRNNI